MTPPGSGEAFDALVAARGGDLLLLLDDRLRILRTGPEAASLAQRPEAGLRGMSLIAAFGSASMDGLARRALTTGEAVNGEAEVGGLVVRQFAVDAVPLRGGLVLSLHDITPLRRIERVRRDFVANVSHELRTPLASIKLLAQTISAGAVEEPSAMASFATQIEREADHLAQLVNGLLDLSMIESGDTRLVPEALDPNSVVSVCLERIGPVAARKDIRVRSQRSRAAVRAMADPARLGQALLNLAHNAVKFSPSAGEVRVGWHPSRRMVRFWVADDGEGVPVVHQERIFERFYKVDRSRGRGAGEDNQFGGGAGLGLAIVRHIAEAHTGRAGVESVEGVGSTFWIEVPIAE